MQHWAFGYAEEAFLTGVERAAPSRRVLAIAVAAARGRVVSGAVQMVPAWAIDRPATVRPMWRAADRSATDIAAAMHVPLLGNRTSLVGVRRYDGQVLRDGTPGRHDGVVTGLSVAYPGPNPVYSVIATVGNQGAETAQWVPGSAWTHIAATFEQFYGVQVATGGYLDAGVAASLNLAGDLTIEAGIRIDDRRHGRGERAPRQRSTRHRRSMGAVHRAHPATRA